MTELRKSKIRKAIVRKLNTAKYETIDIIVDQEHEIEWTEGKIDELMKKSANITKLVVKDYQETEGQVLSDLNLSGQKAFPGETSGKRALSTSEKNGFDSL